MVKKIISIIHKDMRLIWQVLIVKHSYCTLIANQHKLFLL